MMPRLNSARVSIVLLLLSGLGSSARSHQKKPIDFKSAAATCERGDGETCSVLAQLYSVGQNVEHDDERAAHFFEKGCELGNSEACFGIGTIYLEGKGRKADGARAAQFYRKACDGRVLDGCYNLGGMYLVGRGISKDVSQATVLLKKACDAGHANACAVLKKTTRDDSSSHARSSPSTPKEKQPEQFRSQCDAGNAEACGALGSLYHDGNGVAQDYKLAAALFRRSCDGGSGSGCGRLAVMYTQTDKGVGKDTPRALALFRKACDLGASSGCWAGGTLLEIGNGLRAALTLYERGCSARDQTSCQLRDQLAPKLK
jgi:hypothetical protein